MPFEHSIEAQNHLLVIRGSGEGTIEEAEDSTRRAAQSFKSGDVSRDFGILINVSGIARALSVDETNTIEKFIAVLQGCASGSIAIIAAAVGTVVPALIIAMNTTSPRQNVQAFTDETEARAWLREKGSRHRCHSDSAKHERTEP